MAARGVVGSAEYQLGADLKPLSKDLATAEGWLKKSGLKSEATYKRAVSTGLGVGGGLIAVQLLAKGIEMVAGAIGDTIREATEFEAALATINTVAKLSDSSLSSLGESIQDLAIDAGKNTKELTDGMYDLVSAGVAADDAMDVLADSATLATGALSTTGEAVDLVTTTLNAWKLEASESARVTDVFAQAVANGKVTASQLAASIAQVAPIAAATGVSLEEVAAGYAAMTAQGTPAAQAATQMRAAMTALLKPNAELARLQGELGGTTFEAMLASDGLAATLQRLSDVAGGQTDVITAALGSTEAYNGMLQITGDSAAGFARNLDDMKKAAKEGGVAVGQAAERMDTLEFRQAQLAAKNQVLMQELGAMLMPLMEGVTAVAGLAVDAVRGLADGINALADAAAGFLDPGRDTRATIDGIAEGLHDKKAALSLRTFAEGLKLSGDEASALSVALDGLNVTEANQANLMQHLARISLESGADIGVVTDAALRMTEAMDIAGFATMSTDERVALFRWHIGDLYEQQGLLNPLLEDGAEAVYKSGIAVSEATTIYLRWTKETAAGRAHLAELNAEFDVLSGILPRVVTETGEANDELKVTKFRVRDAAAALAGLTDVSVDLAVRGLGRIRSEAKAAEKMWDKLKGGADGNRKALRRLNDEIGKWARRYKRALLNNDTEAAAYAALQLQRLEAEKLDRQAVIDEIKAQQRALWMLGEEVKGLPSHKTVDIAVNLLGNAAQLLKDAFPFLASGGPTQARKAYIVGEEGPEMWVEDRPGYMLDAKATARAMARPASRGGAVGFGDGGVSLTVNVNAGAFLGHPEDAQRMARQITPHLRRELDRLALRP